MKIDKRKWKARKERWAEGAGTAFTIFLIIFLIFNVATFFKGLHNVDLAHNYATLLDSLNQANKEQGGNQTIELTPYSEIQDKGSDFQTFPLHDYYILGLNQMEFAFNWGMISAGALGVMISRKIFKRKK